MGLKPIKNIIQIDSMDNDLKVGLWNAAQLFYWDTVSTNWLSGSVHNDDLNILLLLKRLWLGFFKEPLDTLDGRFSDTYSKIRDRFFNKYEWYEVYDFIEFISQNYPNEKTNESFRARCNSVLEKELSGYRFVDGGLTKISSEEEISEIEEALNIPDEFKGVRMHLKTALIKLSDRKSPDYRNSIKESISAIEALAKIISGQPKAGLRDALEKIEKEVKLHPALKDSFIKLYGYTSDSDGIRHALLGESNLDFEDAKFMLVSSSAFVNYLITKSRRK